MFRRGSERLFRARCGCWMLFRTTVEADIQGGNLRRPSPRGPKCTAHTFPPRASSISTAGRGNNGEQTSRLRQAFLDDCSEGMARRPPPWRRKGLPQQKVWAGGSTVTHSRVTRFRTYEALKTEKRKKTPKKTTTKIRDTPSSATAKSVTWACGAAKFSLEQV